MSKDTDTLMQLSEERNKRIEAEKQLMFSLGQLDLLKGATIDFIELVLNSFVKNKRSYTHFKQHVGEVAKNLQVEISDSNSLLKMNMEKYGKLKECITEEEFNTCLSEVHEYAVNNREPDHVSAARLGTDWLLKAEKEGVDPLDLPPDLEKSTYTKIFCVIATVMANINQSFKDK